MTRDECIAFCTQFAVQHTWANVMLAATGYRATAKSLDALSDDELLGLVKRLKAHAELGEERDEV